MWWNRRPHLRQAQGSDHGFGVSRVRPVDAASIAAGRRPSDGVRRPPPSSSRPACRGCPGGVRALIRALLPHLRGSPAPPGSGGGTTTPGGIPRLPATTDSGVLAGLSAAGVRRAPSGADNPADSSRRAGRLRRGGVRQPSRGGSPARRTCQRLEADNPGCQRAVGLEARVRLTGGVVRGCALTREPCRARERGLRHMPGAVRRVRAAGEAHLSAPGG
jgi:hypothetical protein